jgi:hypothetical protein
MRWAPLQRLIRNAWWHGFVFGFIYGVVALTVAWRLFAGPK